MKNFNKGASWAFPFVQNGWALGERAKTKKNQLTF